LKIVLPTTLGIRNPATTKPFSIQISSYDSANNLIDAGVSYVTNTIISPMQASYFHIINKTSSTNMDLSNYTFTVRISGDISVSDYINGSFLILTFPTQILVNSNSKCFSTVSPIFDLGCSRNGQVYTIPV
jgi:hypothetical protein